MDNTINSARLQQNRVLNQNKIEPDKFSKLKREQLGPNDPTKFNIYKNANREPDKIEQNLKTDKNATANLKQMQKANQTNRPEQNQQIQRMQQGDERNIQVNNAKNNRAQPNSALSNENLIGRNVDIYA